MVSVLNDFDEIERLDEMNLLLIPVLREYSWDDADDRARVNVVEYPERPHRRKTRTLHPSGSAVTARASGVGSLTSTYDEWPFLSERYRL